MQSNAQTPDMKNLIIAVVLSTAVLIGWQLLVEEPKREAAAELARIEQEKQAKYKAEHPDTQLPDTPEHAANATTQEQPRGERLASSARVRMNTGALHGSVNLKGMRLDDVTLANFHTETDPQSPEVELLSPAGGKDTYFAEFGWLAGNPNQRVPSADTLWNSDQSALSAKQPLVAKWDNEQGQEFEQRITAEDDYLFRIEQQVKNTSDQPVTLYPYGLISRSYADENEHYYILHEGPIAVFNKELQEVSYENLRDDTKQPYEQVKGWLGITDKYWLTALIPDQESTFNATMSYFNRGGQDRYQVDYRGEAVTIAPGESAHVSVRVFVGAKKVRLLDRYSEQFNIPLFDRAVDFGMLYFLTKPIFYALQYFNALLGNFGLAIMLLTVCIKLLLFPLANKSYGAMSQLKVLTPKINEIRERFGDDKIKMNQEIMELYKQEKVNPASGCLPMLLQIPVFFALYKVLFVTIEMRHAPFYGWINDLSAPDPTNIFTLFGVIDWSPPSMLMIGAWPLIMCATMVVQQQLNPKPNDPAQAMVMQWLPFIFLFLFASFPAGLVIYWAWNNSLSILQQWVIQTRHTSKAGK